LLQINSNQRRSERKKKKKASAVKFYWGTKKCEKFIEIQEVKSAKKLKKRERSNKYTILIDREA